MPSIAQRTYSSYENGNHDIPTHALITLAKYYNTSVDYLLGLTDKVQPYPRSKDHK
ncbi:helix-turn-helix transcriptional regulator [Wukongibacter baidiensis]|uniref:helix-turn-helix domain-containing protein n=1 Tax=Wukongibacter baidiensis TaxID=1723361 RepID=UPI003D7FDDCB